MKKITTVTVLENYRVRLRFNDGVEGEVDFSAKPRSGVYASWNSYENFRKVRLSADPACALCGSNPSVTGLTAP